jgi:hypothetical protein
MHSLWFLPALALAVLTYYVRRMKRSAKLERNDAVPFLRGVSNLCIFISTTTPFTESSAPHYLLECDLSRVEAA